MQGLRLICRAWRDARKFKKLPLTQRRLVVYSEDGNSWPHLGPIVETLVSEHGLPLTYLTSSIDEPILSAAPEGVTPLFIGDGHIRTWLFRSMEAEFLLMTMPDLETFHIKRSVYPVHYIYTYHSIVSTHMIYQKAAFDHFDTVFCVGPHHEREIRATEKFYGLSAKIMFHHGYPRLDTLLAEDPNNETIQNNSQIRVLIAPSWGPKGLLETTGHVLVEILLEAGLHVTVRPHPMTRNQASGMLDQLQAKFAAYPGFEFEENIASTESIRRSHLMVSDWSGAALEYAFSRERPVLFVDVPRKVNNPEWEGIGIAPIEDSIRNEIGSILSPDRFSEAPAIIQKLIEEKENYQSQIQSSREKYVYNLGSSARAAADYLAKIIAENR